MENYLLSELTYRISHTRSSIFYNKKNNRKEASFLEYKLHTRASHLFLAADISLICFSSISSVSFATIFTAERLNQKIKRYPLGKKNENRSISPKLQRSQRQKKKKKKVERQNTSYIAFSQVNDEFCAELWPSAEMGSNCGAMGWPWSRVFGLWGGEKMRKRGWEWGGREVQAPPWQDRQNRKKQRSKN